MKMHKSENIQGIQKMILFIVESFANIKLIGFVNIKPSSEYLYDVVSFEFYLN